jgi:hypothetical protein
MNNTQLSESNPGGSPCNQNHGQNWGEERLKRCQRCILPKSYPGIAFDANGICSFCTAYEKPNFENKTRELKHLMKEARRDGHLYQAVVPLSGGKDSAYVLYVMRRIYDLRVLAINFDNGFRSSAAEANFKILTDQLGVDSVSIKPNWNLMRDLYAAFVRITGEFCTVCNSMGYLTIMSFLMKQFAAAKHKPLVVGGWSKHIEATPGMYSFDLSYFYDVISQAGLSGVLRHSEMVDEMCLDVLMSTPDPRQARMGENFPLIYIMLPEFMPWNPHHIAQTLKKDLGWISPPESDDETHFDCIMYPVAKYFERRKYGFSQNTVMYSALVREGRISRTVALKNILKEKKGIPAEFSRFLTRLGLKRTDVNWEGRWHPQRQ